MIWQRKNPKNPIIIFKSRSKARGSFLTPPAFEVWQILRLSSVKPLRCNLTHSVCYEEGEIGLCQNIVFLNCLDDTNFRQHLISAKHSGPQPWVSPDIAQDETFLLTVSTPDHCVCVSPHQCAWKTYTKFCCKFCFVPKLHSLWLLGLNAELNLF